MSNSLGTWFKSHYDKLVAVVVLVVLLASLLYLLLLISSMRQLQQRFDEQINSMTIAHEKATPVDPTILEAALARIEKPIPAGVWTNDFMRPEQRVYCIDCRKPIVFAAQTCPFCDATQPDPGKLDVDDDGIPDEWEGKMGLDSMDPSDATKDKDGDRFSNIAEWKFSTDPNDAKVYPPVVSELFLKKIEVRKFPMKFEGKVKQAGGGGYRFQLNLRGKSQFVLLNDVVDGWKVAGYEEKTRTVTTPVGERAEDVSQLTLTRGKKTATLVYRKGVVFKEFVATLRFNITAEEKRVIEETTVTFMNEKFMVISIDMENKRVLIRALDGGKETLITGPGTAEKPAEAAAPEVVDEGKTAAAAEPVPPANETVGTAPGAAEKEAAPAEAQEAETTANQNEDAS